MNDMLYYPGFEIKNETKLKYALLYFDKLRPIIPELYISKEKYLSTNTIRVIESTDLIQTYTPTHIESEIASTYACETIEKILRHPDWYFRSKGAERIEKWHSPIERGTILFEGKFAHYFRTFCIENKLADSVSCGLRMNTELANIYMSTLADIIAKRNEFEMFTDMHKYNNYLIRNDEIIAIEQKANILTSKSECEINACLPYGIENIPIQKIINLRNSFDFAQLRTAFNIKMKEYINKDDQEFCYRDLLKINDEIKCIMGLTLGVTAAAILTCSAISSLGENGAVPVVLLASAYDSFSTLHDIPRAKDYFAELKTKTQARRYLTKIKKLAAEH